MINKEQLYDYDKRVSIFQDKIKHFKVNDKLKFLYNQDKISIITSITSRNYDIGIFGLEKSVNYYYLNNSNFIHTLFSLFNTLIELERDKEVIKFYE